MRGDRDIERAVKAGEHNKRIADLIRNWCEHIRIERTGGRGLVEAMTNLPIGHGSPACDFASGGGMFTWDWAEAAVAFYDKNCAACLHRKPVGFPNISVLVDQRDAQRAAQEKANSARREEQQRALEALRAERASIKQRLTAISATLIDQVSEIHENKNEDSVVAFVKTAAVAPEAFSPEVVNYLFDLIDRGETWIADAALQALRQLGRDEERIVAAALKCLASHAALETAASIVEANPDLAPGDLIGAALPALIQLANPSRGGFAIHHQVVRPGPLIAVFQAHSEIVSSVLGDLLNSRSSFYVETAARGISAIAEVCPEVPVRFARDLTALLARAEWLLNEEVDDERELMTELREAAACAWQSAPDEVDELFWAFFETASDAGQARLAYVLKWVLTDVKRAHDRMGGHAESRAIQRLVQIATTASSSDVLRQLEDAFHGDSYGLAPSVLAQMETMLGAAAVLDGKIDQLREKPVIDGGQLAALERESQKRQLTSLRSAMIRWVSQAAAGDEIAVRRYLDFMDALPSAREQLVADLVESLGGLMTSPQALNEALPRVYNSMFGSSVLVRGAAAQALKDLPAEAARDLPPLVIEALLVLAHDPYVYVHRTAFYALEALPIPDEMLAKTSQTIQALTLAYSLDKELDSAGQQFLLNLIPFFVRRFESAAAPFRTYFVERVSKLEPMCVARELRPLTWALAGTPGFAEVVLNVLVDREERSLDIDRIFDAMDQLPDERLVESKEKLLAVGKALAEQGADIRTIVEPLVRIGSWEDAQTIAKLASETIGSAPREKRRRLWADSLQLALQLEVNILAGNPDSPKDFLSRFAGVLDQCWEAERYAGFDPSGFFEPN